MFNKGKLLHLPASTPFFTQYITLAMKVGLDGNWSCLENSWSRNRTRRHPEVYRNPDHTDLSEMAVLPQFTLFNPTSETWESYIVWFECILEANNLTNITDNWKQALFLSYCGTEILRWPEPSSLRNWCRWHHGTPYKRSYGNITCPGHPASPTDMHSIIRTRRRANP